ncbi:hypothetical protein Cylst_5293 [Cylindrospermum stagnale PCC 7417]|uniref:Uncharacterized protein n=1 Tax=Cylindrospermum stagnale PCC 7417 TaxID=56107 RepID=K9X6Q3_9NOST|nr:hypothetical protein [Cylindrospermum stagnale]AFZ27322.1 hypothetical protein Cylst_5293 [Cylindrospermum stagnale PCC 7417]
MNRTTSNSQNSALYEFKEAHPEEIQTITEALVKITSLPAEAIKSHLDAMLEKLVKTTESPFYETASDEEWFQALHEWSYRHKQNIPPLSDYAVSRAGIYEDEEI